MPATNDRRALTFRLPALAGLLLLAVGLTGCGSGPSPAETASAAASSATEVGAGEAAVAATVPEAAPAEPAAPAATSTAPAPPTSVPRTTVPRATAAPVRTTAPAPAAPATTAAPVVPRFAPGQRINPSSADVQAAIVRLRQRIPLFQPTDPQLRTFADAACTAFDQGQTQAQVQAAVGQAVTYVQGKSITPADADFAVRLVVQLRCPGYLQ